MANLAWEDLDQMVEGDPLLLRDVAWEEITKLREDRRCLGYALQNLGEIVDAATKELGLSHEANAQQVVAAIRAVRA